jgi:hypothetical protein
MTNSSVVKRFNNKTKKDKSNINSIQNSSNSKIQIKAGVIYYKDLISGHIENKNKNKLNAFGFNNNEYLRKKRIEYYDKLNKKE